jgi:PAS domain S-box-containing protein
MDSDALFRRYQELQEYIGWTGDDARRVNAMAPFLEPYLTGLIDDFYQEIERHPDTRRVIIGGAEQIDRLRGTLGGWLRELLHGPYDKEYVARRWRAGWRHVEIGLDQVYTNVALSRLRQGLLQALEERLQGDHREALASRRSLNMLLDLDLAIIEDAYHTEYLAWRLTLNKERSQAAFRTLVEAAPCMILISRPDRTILYLNPFAERVTGYEAAEVVGKDLLHIFIDDSIVYEAVNRAREHVLNGHPSLGVEHPIRCKDGTQRHVIRNRQCLPDYEGGPAILAVGQDVTSLIEAQEKALQAERLAAIGQMMTGLAHESGNALARSQACLEMLALEVHELPEALGLIERIQKAQNHLQQLYEEVRSYAAPIKLERVPWDVALIWRQAWENLLVRRQGRDAELHEECDQASRKCAIDPFRLEQVFRNILDNSLAACRDPVRISIQCTAADRAGSPELRIVVRDNGPGLNPVQARRIFDPFFTTKTKGTGLGMAIAKRIIEAHDGRISVGPGSGVGSGASLPSDGAEIVIILPRDSL